MTTIQTDQAARPDILEKLTYHKYERDDMTLDDCLEYLANRWKKIHGRPERALIMQITELLAASPQKPVAPSSQPYATFQDRVQPWMMECFGAKISADRMERNHRFFEEATELVQANGMTRSEAHQLVDYTFGRPVGELHQEVGGVMVTLAALCLASNSNMHIAGETELARIWTKVEKIRAKQAAKPKHSPLPEATNQPVHAKALTDEQIKDAILRLDDCEVIDGNGVTQEAIAIVRALLASQPSAQEPLFWYRPCNGGETYEGPIHNNSVGGKMLRDEKPGEWFPLFTDRQPLSAQVDMSADISNAMINDEGQRVTIGMIARWFEEAAQHIADWGAYASDHFQKKHRLTTDVELFNRRALAIRSYKPETDVAAVPNPGPEDEPQIRATLEHLLNRHGNASYTCGANNNPETYDEMSKRSSAARHELEEFVIGLLHRKSAAPTAQPQVDMATCNHIFIAAPIGDRNAANTPVKAVCKHCGYEPQPRADAGVEIRASHD